MATVSIVFTGQTPDRNPYQPADHPNGGNFTNRGAANAALFSGAWYGTNASANSLWSCDVDPAVNNFSGQTVFDTVDSNSRGQAVFNNSGNGFMFIARNNDVRVFALAAWALSGSPLATYTTTFATGGILNIDVTQSTGTYVVKNDATTIGTYVNTAYTSGLKIGPVARGAGRIRSFTLTYTPAQTVDTFTDPLVPGAAASGTQTGFANGAITANFGGLTFTGTVSGSALSGTMSSFVDGGLCPLLPAAAVAGTFTQGGNTAPLTRAVSVPTGLRELRDGSGNPANFAGIVLGDDKYLGQSFADTPNPLTTDDRPYWDPAYGFLIDQDGRLRINATDHPTDPVPAFPYDTTIWIRRGADGRVYSHDITLTEEVVDDATIDSVGTVRIGATVSVTVSNFDVSVSSGSLDGVALTSASNTSIVIPGLVDTEEVPRPGTRTLSLTGGSETATTDVPVLLPTGYTSYVADSFTEAVNGVAVDVVPVSVADGDFFLYQASPAAGKTTEVSELGIITNHIGTQTLWHISNSTNVARSFNVTTGGGAAEVGGGGTIDPTRPVSMRTLTMRTL